MSLLTTRRKDRESSPVVPDSTTRDRGGFNEGEDVLLLDKDGLFYLGTVVEVDLVTEQCLVKFGDNTERWSSYRDLNKLTLPDSDLLCVVCKGSQSKPSNDIRLCDHCSRGYHQLCHQPYIAKEFIEPDSSWMCHKCVEQTVVGQEEVSTKEVQKESATKTRTSGSSSSSSSSMKLGTSLTDWSRGLPYDLDSLTWDPQHKTNMQKMYCYCGKTGEWYKKMLQCVRCKQWFHERCLTSLRGPIIFGDRFHVFVCSLCNGGKEYTKRLDMRWVDIVHLALFNLTVLNAKKYYDFDTAILPYISDSWPKFQVPQKLRDVSLEDRRDEILSVLQNNRTRFKCGREIKKKTTIWGLRLRVPPPAPCINLPSTGPITDDMFKGNSWLGTRRKRFHTSTESSPVPLKYTGRKTKEDSPPLDEKPMKFHLLTYSPSKRCPNSPETVLRESSKRHEKSKTGSKISKSDQLVQQSETVTKTKVERSRIENRIRTRLSNELYKKRLKHENSEEPCVHNRLMRKRKVNKQTEEMVCLKDLKSRKARKLLRKAIVKSQHTEKEFQAQHSVPCFPAPLLTPGDTSGDDTSSRGTLDSFIPPPKDFEGQNNPFCNLDFNNTHPAAPVPSLAAVSAPVTASSSSISAVASRATKRKLSEKDIRISKNGEIKRRRYRRKKNRNASTLSGSQNTSNVQSAFGSLPSKTADSSQSGSSTPVKILNSSPYGQSSSNVVNSQISNCVDYALKGRLRSETNSEKFDGNHCVGQMRETTKISLNDLKSSVHNYFGAANRIASGEKFHVLAKRIVPNGKVQYLIEWEGPPT